MLKKLVLFGMAAAAICAHAQSDGSYPSRPIKFVVSSVAGGGSDAIARLLAAKISPILKGTVIVENRPGAGGTIAMGATARSAPDGYTLVLGGVSTNVLIPLSNPKLTYDPIKDLTPVAQIGLASIVLVAKNDFPANNLKELVALARAKPSTLQYASFGIGSSGHYCGEMLNIVSKIDLGHVAYQSAPQILTDMMGGHIQFGFVDSASGAPAINSGKVKALAACPTRSPSFPDLRSFEDDGMTVSSTASNAFRWAFYGPAKMPPAIVNKLTAAMRTVVEMPDVQAKLREFSVNPVFATGEELGKLAPAELAAWKTIADTAKIKIE
ncbi:Bug family tripartite tricarboxylate transporter substrate binding protein [Variovorax sp. LARHSF232]